jgi:hypothetical protein
VTEEEARHILRVVQDNIACWPPEKDEVKTALSNLAWYILRDAGFTHQHIVRLAQEEKDGKLV